MPEQAGKTAASFPTTRWSDVARAACADPLLKQQALGRLLSAYLPAFRAHLVGRKRIPVQQAEDLLQGFVCDQLVAEDLAARADPSRGRFRAFVLVALDRYVNRVRREQNAEKRKPSAPLLHLDPDLAASPTPADSFDLAWARRVVGRAVADMRDRCQAANQQRVWEVFETCTLIPLLEGAAPPPQRDLAHRLNFSSVQQVSNSLVTGKRMFARVLRNVIAEYAHDEQEVEKELNDLFTILSSSGGNHGSSHVRRTQ